MSHAKRRLTLAVMAAAVGIGVFAATVRADDATQQMQQKIDQLEAKVQNLEATQAANQADVTAATQQLLLNDADRQSNLMAGMGGGSGYDPATGFHIGSDDGNFYLHPFALFQFQGVLNYRGAVKAVDEGALAPVGGTNFEDGFDVRRLNLGVEGHVFSPNLGYYFMFETFRIGGAPGLDDGYVTYKLNDQMTLKGGQFKDITWHESSVDDSYELAADESLVNGLIGGSMGGIGGPGSDQARVQGVSLQYAIELLRGEVALHDGYGSQNTPFTNSATPIIAPGAIHGVPPTNWGASARVDVKIIGDADAWDEYSRFSAYGDKSDLLVAGGGMEYTEAGDDCSFWWTADVQYDGAKTLPGLDGYAAFLGQHVRAPSGAVPGPGGVKTTANSYGFLAQAGYLITPQWEPFVRYDFTHLDDGLYNAVGVTNHNLHELMAGINYYMWGQNAKFTVQAAYLPGGCPLDMDGLGYLQQSANHPEWALMAQFQLKI